jgi:hypothetical protein
MIFWGLAINFIACNPEVDSHHPPSWLSTAKNKISAEMIKSFGTEQAPLIERGIQQVSHYWRQEDGDQDTFENFIRRNYCSDLSARDQMFMRFQDNFETLYGHLDRIVIGFRRQADLDIGPLQPFDELFAAYDPGAHIISDFFNNKLAFTVLLNFPLSNLRDDTNEGSEWTRRQWAERRLASTFVKRLPSEISLEISRVSSESEKYIANYNIWMHHLLDDSSRRLFPPKLRLLSHWNLRDEIRSQYAQGPNALEKQRLILKVMERIVDQTIPEAIIDNPALDWYPFANKVVQSTVNDAESSDLRTTNISGKSEPDTRYLMLQKNFLSQKAADPYWPTLPNFIQRRFELNRQMSEQRVKSIFEKLLLSSHFKQLAQLIRKNLGRELEPFDIWYNGFRSQSSYSQDVLDGIVKKKYPTPEAFEKDIPRILFGLGFPKARIAEITPLIVVDPARGSGHAWGAQMRGVVTHLRTRIGQEGMDYKGYNIAVHELGHNVEQVISINNMDYILLAGVPNNAFTEAMAFLFQARDLELLGLEEEDPFKTAMRTLHDFWGTCEIAAVALVDNAVWHWMYENPAATPSEIKAATLAIAREIWNTYFAPIFKVNDATILAVYSHMISYPLYLTDYPLGHLITYQIEEVVRQEGLVGPVFDRMVRIGNINPDSWMKQATGSEVGPQALFQSTEAALKYIEKK